jgi:hypothetical protein
MREEDGRGGGGGESAFRTAWARLKLKKATTSLISEKKW